MEINGNILKKDRENFMLHYLNSYELGHNYLELDSKIKKLLTYIDKQLEKYKNDNNILEKYEWLKKPKYDSGNSLIEAF